MARSAAAAALAEVTLLTRALGMVLIGLGLAATAPCWADDTPGAQGPPSAPPAPMKKSSLWFDPSTLPFLPVPLIGVDPNSGTTLGILPVWLHTNDQQQISRIIAPDLIYNPYFGVGAHFRLFAYPSEERHWSFVTGISEHVQREIDFNYEDGLRDHRWSYSYTVIDDRDGTPRFYGIGNESQNIDETDYTQQRALAEAQVGFNFNHSWQLLYTAREQNVDVTPGTLTHEISIESKFGRILGVGTTNQFLNRLAVVFDTRDDVTIPSDGVKWVAYGGLASRTGLFNDSMYSEAGIDGRAFFPVFDGTTLATHMALRYLPTADRVPFWALSSLGGATSEVGGEQALRGYGSGRYYDRDYFASTIEIRRRVLAFDASATHVEVELTPFVDLGRVYSHANTFPLQQLHQVYGIGFRGVARPSVVGYVDIGYGSDGIAAFTGINYPF
jgi:hypothetical protein